jgi:hypothetical protein
VHPAALSHVMILISARGAGADLRSVFQVDSVRP